MDDKIATSAELAEAAALPCHHEVHTDPDAPSALKNVPGPMQKVPEKKSPARWAYERLILYIKNFEEQLDGEHEVAMGFAGGDAGVLRIEGMGYFDPDIVTFYGSDSGGARTQLVQHVSQLNVILRAMAKPKPEEPAKRIGFRLVSDGLVPDPEETV
ncbi:DUF6173 family protein [Phaeobacter sp. B1627]|uniref:DUF6173 family protein n=1 Tax=Phaeobacter sp. B1627 TaxID=2583809 RepID=UPI0011197117|nr:DUF6173 family protein [Phaeobacter sp. B1627]TNJ47631.1 hypothetical protein FGE21_03445 [Phaeobacter sp. B1627]